MNKLKSFTILELMVVMLLSILVMGIAYQGYLLFHKQFLSFKKSSEKIANVCLMDRLMHSDISECKLVIKNSRGINCLSADKDIQYQWADRFVLRKQGSVIDTFYLNRIEGVFLNLSGKEAIEGGIVDEVIFTDKVQEEEKTFHYLKKYGADILINQSNRSDNGRN